MTATADTLVEVDGLVRRFGETTAVDGLSFSVRRGEMFGLIGPDGAGKTTTLRVLLGLLQPHAGRVRTCGLDPLKESISFFASIHGVKGWKARRDELLDLLRMTPFRKRLADRLSGGMKQKLALSCTLIHTPELLILDEPTTGVDPVSRRDFWKILAHLQRAGLTLLVTTPYLDEAERCQRIGMMDHGRLLELDAPAAIKARAGGALLEVIARPKRAAQDLLLRRPEVAAIESFGERLHATLHPAAAARAAETAGTLGTALRDAGLEVEAIRPVPPTLEDLFIARMQAGEVHA
ncbi:MAG TPA: multidrug ABC transporter ATP-binding protein [Acidobacteria bacterium]|nr:multidrug ABC transporter ATP-binding protein [Acidobacteriota bacterium]